MTCECKLSPLLHHEYHQLLMKGLSIEEIL